MAVTDYIAIRGLVSADTEIFQGIGGASAEETPADTNHDPGYPDVQENPVPETPISADPDLAELIWQGQNEKLEHENKYCDQLQKRIKRKEQRVSGIRDKIIDLIEEFLSEAIGAVVDGYVSTTPLSKPGGFIAGVLTEFGIEWALDELILLFIRGNELLEGIKAENEKLLQIEKSRENYEYREQVLVRHREDIKMILGQIRSAEENVTVTQDLQLYDLIQRLTDLALRDDTIELGDMRLHSKGRVVNF